MLRSDIFHTCGNIGRYCLLLILRAKTQKKKASPPKIAQLQAIAMIAQASRCLHFKMLTARPE